jgi:Fe-S oxidoreductase
MKVLLSGVVNLKHTNQIDVLDSILNTLKKLDVEVSFIDGEIMCGEASINLGISEKILPIFKKFKEKVEEIKPDVVVSAYAAGVAKWARDLPNNYGLKLPVPYLHLSEFFAEEFAKKKPDFSSFPHTYFVQHGCTLGRKLGRFGAIREILKLIPELKVMEEDYPTAEIEGIDPAEFNSCPGAWLNFTQPDLGDYVKENYVLDILLPHKPEYAGSTCANGHFGIRKGLEIAEIDSIKPLYFTQLLEKVWK